MTRYIGRHGNERVAKAFLISAVPPVPIGASAMLSSKIVKNAKLKVIDGAPHGLCTTHKDQINAELLAFLKS